LLLVVVVVVMVVYLYCEVVSWRQNAKIPLGDPED